MIKLVALMVAFTATILHFPVTEENLFLAANMAIAGLMVISVLVLYKAIGD